MADSAPANLGKNSIPQPSIFLVFLSLILVPIFYALLLSCAAAAVWLVVLVAKWSLVVCHTLHGRAVVHVLLLLGLLALGAIMCAWSILKGIFATFQRGTPFTPALLVPLGMHRGLGHLIAALCSTMNTRIPDAVILHSEPTFFVTHGKVQVFNGVAKGRILAIGMPLLGGLTINELRAVLAHEFAHFTGNDLIYSAIALPVFQSASTAYHSLEESAEQAESLTQTLPLLLPKFLVDMFMRVFFLIDVKLSQQREARADAVAVSVCGAQSQRMCLMKSAGLIFTFDDDEAVQIVKQAAAQTPGTNRLTAFRKALPNLVQIANRHYQEVLALPDDPYSTHPSIKRRLDAIKDIPERYNDTGFAASLLTDLEQHEEKLSLCCAKMAVLNNGFASVR